MQVEAQSNERAAGKRRRKRCKNGFLCVFFETIRSFPAFFIFFARIRVSIVAFFVASKYCASSGCNTKSSDNVEGYKRSRKRAFQPILSGFLALSPFSARRRAQTEHFEDAAEHSTSNATTIKQIKGVKDCQRARKTPVFNNNKKKKKKLFTFGAGLQCCLQSISSKTC